jgi:hypothetical protein
MKKMLPLLIVLILATGAFAQQSLGDIARQARAKKRPNATTVRFDDETNVRGTTGQISVVGQEKPSDQSADTKAADSKASDSKDKPKMSMVDAEKQKTEEWSKKVEAQKKEVATLQRELDIVQREQRLRAANYYADAGNALRDPAKFTEDSRKEQEEIDTKKHALDAAQQKLADLQEEARRAGVPSSATN